MKLLIQQQIFSFRDRFTVMDEYGNDRFYVMGELFSWGKKLHVTDLSGRGRRRSVAESKVSWLGNPFL